MQRFSLVLALVVMLSIGMLAGSLLTPAVRAQKATLVDDAGPGPGPNAPNGGGYMPSYPNMQNTYTYPVPVRWQVIVVGGFSQQSPPIALLIDTFGGATYYLEAANGRYYWSRITR